MLPSRNGACRSRKCSPRRSKRTPPLLLLPRQTGATSAPTTPARRNIVQQHHHTHATRVLLTSALAFAFLARRRAHVTWSTINRPASAYHVRARARIIPFHNVPSPVVFFGKSESVVRLVTCRCAVIWLSHGSRSKHIQKFARASVCERKIASRLESSSFTEDASAPILCGGAGET